MFEQLAVSECERIQVIEKFKDLDTEGMTKPQRDRPTKNNEWLRSACSKIVGEDDIIRLTDLLAYMLVLQRQCDAYTSYVTHPPTHPPTHPSTYPPKHTNRLSKVESPFLLKYKERGKQFEYVANHATTGADLGCIVALFRSYDAHKEGKRKEEDGVAPHAARNALFEAAMGKGGGGATVVSRRGGKERGGGGGGGCKTGLVIEGKKTASMEAAIKNHRRPGGGKMNQGRKGSTSATKAHLTGGGGGQPPTTSKKKAEEERWGQVMDALHSAAK